VVSDCVIYALILVYLNLSKIFCDVIKGSVKNRGSMEPFERSPGSVPVIIYLKTSALKNFNYTVKKD